MASSVKTKTRLHSVQSTQKVIKAMELVASSKIKKARDKARNIESYFSTLRESIALISQYEVVRDTLFSKSNDAKTLIIAYSSDMGMAGAYNHNITKKLLLELKENPDSLIYAVGKKIVNKLTYEGYTDFQKITEYGQIPEIKVTDQIYEFIDKQLKEKKISNIKIIYTKFINPLIQEIDVIDFNEIIYQEETNAAPVQKELLVELSPEELMNDFVKMYLKGLIYSTLLQSLASEHSYRRNAMETANKNSLELIDKLNLELNRIRQAMITQEISEIVGGSEALAKE